MQLAGGAVEPVEHDQLNRAADATAGERPALARIREPNLTGIRRALGELEPDQESGGYEQPGENQAASRHDLPTRGHGHERRQESEAGRKQEVRAERPRDRVANRAHQVVTR